MPLAFLASTAIPAAAEDSRIIMPMDGKAVTDIHQGKGKINSVNVKAGKINLSHEPIANLGWPAMTMDLEVQDKALLTGLKPGQKVIFKLIEARKGQYVVSEITVVK
jgi:Cu(I)/Ag(I) efflux system membrane fusion protein